MNGGAPSRPKRSGRTTNAVKGGSSVVLRPSQVRVLNYGNLPRLPSLRRFGFSISCDRARPIFGDALRRPIGCMLSHMIPPW
jgi:hypothetical protein